MAVSTAVPSNAIARVVGIETNFENRRSGAYTALPQQVALIGQVNTDKALGLLTPKVIFSAADAAKEYGNGSPLHLAALQLLPITGDGLGGIPLTAYPLAEGVSDTALSLKYSVDGPITKTTTYILQIGGIASQSFTVSVGDTAEIIAGHIEGAVNATYNMPVIALKDIATADKTVTFTAKWKGVTSNEILLVLIGSDDSGLVFTPPSNPIVGAGNPDITLGALSLIKEKWETLAVNCQTLEGADGKANLAKYSAWNEGRWGALTRKPAIVISGNIAKTLVEAQAKQSPDKADRTNAIINAPDCRNMPFVLAARTVAKIAQLADANPAFDFGGLRLTGLIPGNDEFQWPYKTKDLAVKGGLSTTTLNGGVINISDTVTFYRPDSDPTPAYRFVVDIIRLQNIIFNIDIEFSNPQWNGAPLIPDDQPTVNPSAKKPKMAVAAAAAIVSSLGLNAIVSSPEESIAEIKAEIDAANPKRLNLAIPVNLSGNANIRSVTINWGFFFGTPTLLT